MFLAIDLCAVRNIAHLLQKTLGYGTRLAIGLSLEIGHPRPQLPARR
jgi:hypothetical protein